MSYDPGLGRVPSPEQIAKNPSKYTHYKDVVDMEWIIALPFLLAVPVFLICTIGWWWTFWVLAPLIGLFAACFDN